MLWFKTRELRRELTANEKSLFVRMEALRKGLNEMYWDGATRSWAGHIIGDIPDATKSEMETLIEQADELHREILEFSQNVYLSFKFMVQSKGGFDQRYETVMGAMEALYDREAQGKDCPTLLKAEETYQERNSAWLGGSDLNRSGGRRRRGADPFEIWRIA